MHQREVSTVTSDKPDVNTPHYIHTLGKPYLFTNYQFEIPPDRHGVGSPVTIVMYVVTIMGWGYPGNILTYSN